MDTTNTSEMTAGTQLKRLKRQLQLVELDRQLDSWTIVKDIASRFYKNLGTPKARACLQLLQADRIGELIRMSCDPHDYDDLSDFADDYAAVSLLKKYDGFPPHLREDTRKAALVSAKDAEVSCAKANYRLCHTEPSRFVTEVLLKASSLISDTLGKCPTLEALASKGISPQFGPGASSSCSGLYTSVYNKLQSRLEVTEKALPMAKTLLRLFPRLADTYPDTDDVEGPFSLNTKFYIVPGNRFTTVPKTAKTDRPICIEPHVNIVLQKMYGSYIRRRLKRMGIDLDCQHLVNSALARQGSIDGSISTIDLSMASDTVSRALVKSLLPDDWYALLDSLRSHRTNYIGDEWFLNHKFSSMGNGFTFELESLLFWGITKAVCLVRGDTHPLVSVYGDDIIVRTRYARGVIHVLNWCGFSVNTDKTFLDTPFRESCGTDFYNGLNIRPYFIKKEVSHASELIKIANGIRHYASRRCNGLFCDGRFHGTWHHICSLLSMHERSVGPMQLGDTVIWASREEVPNAAYPIYVNGVLLAIQCGLKGIQCSRRFTRLLTGAFLTSRSPSWEGCKVDQGSPRQLLHRGHTRFRKVTSVIIPIRSDSPLWLH